MTISSTGLPGHMLLAGEFRCASVPAPPLPTTITEHGLRLAVAPVRTAQDRFYADQRDNRKRLGIFGGQAVLDLCCNSGEFAIWPTAAGADEVVGVDLDEEALELAKHNARLNKLRARFVYADIFPACARCRQQRRTVRHRHLIRLR